MNLLSAVRDGLRTVSLLRASPRTSGTARGHRFRPGLEPLESRALLSAHLAATPAFRGPSVPSHSGAALRLQQAAEHAFPVQVRDRLADDANALWAMPDDHAVRDAPA
jgi:hypothetical protein